VSVGCLPQCLPERAATGRTQDHRPDRQAQFWPPQSPPTDINPPNSELNGLASTGPIKLLIRRAGFETLAAHQRFRRSQACSGSIRAEHPVGWGQIGDSRRESQRVVRVASAGSSQDRGRDAALPGLATPPGHLPPRLGRQGLFRGDRPAPTSLPAVSYAGNSSADQPPAKGSPAQCPGGQGFGGGCSHHGTCQDGPQPPPCPGPSQVVCALSAPPPPDRGSRPGPRPGKLGRRSPLGIS
jgi:hypothetical protein